MKNCTAILSIVGQVGICGNREVFLGFAHAQCLYSLSFADILNDDTGEGYQRPYNKKHSGDFKNYIHLEGSSTIPLTFNLRKSLAHTWKIEKTDNGYATLILDGSEKCLARVDCQHRLGELENSDVPLAFMTYIGLDLREEMALFTVINGKAKGLSSSLTDYHESNLLNDLANEAPHYYIARRLNEDPSSPWYRLIRYGGETTSGLKRRTSFRMMQKAVQHVLKETNGRIRDVESKYEIIISFWKAVQNVFPDEWADHRHHLISKGVGLYSLMMLLAELVKGVPDVSYGTVFFETKLIKLKAKIDWNSNGTFASAGGHKGAREAYSVLKGMLGI
ncbi:MAG: DGQHR domain-containing protein [Anaerohalosphaera sp.]|nr:DGQHR domain-containing protein [Anaerohalosphaera sp.]